MNAPPFDFSADTGAWHRRLDVEKWDNIYVIGDVHGCLSTLERLLEKLDVSEDDLVVFVGDLLRKGPHSHGVVKLVRESPNMFSVRGNNEEKILRGEKTLPGLSPADVEFIQSMPVVLSWDDQLVVHGGVDPRKSLPEHSVDDLQNMRSLVPDGSYDRPFWFERHDGPQRVFFGHTVLDTPVETDWAIGLDTGCVYGGNLTAYDVKNEAFVAVSRNDPGKSRSENKIATPPYTARAD